jgi:predicted RND superfamily exporter protein
MPPRSKETVDEKGFKEETEESPLETKRMSIPKKVARFQANHPWKCLIGTLLVSTLFSAYGILFSDFEVSVDDKGWRSRGTLIANREMQNDVLRRIKTKLFEDTDGSEWEDAVNNVAYGYIPIDSMGDEDEEGGSSTSTSSDSTSSDSTSSANSTIVEGCDSEKYYGNIIFKKNLHATYKTDRNLDTSTKSILDPDVLFDICAAETKTHELLQEKKLCGGCPGTDQCLPPYSLLLVLRLTLNAMDVTCSELKDLYTPSVQEQFTNTLVECTQEVKENYDPTTYSYGTPTKCPPGFQTSLIDQNFGENGSNVLRHSSSYFVTYKIDDKDLYDVRSQYGYTDESIVTSAYDTLQETQNEIYVNSILVSDMTLAVGSLTITFLAMGIHTKSFWLTIMGVLQIIYSVPLSYFVYYFIAGLRFFPFLNFIGVFVAAALGADDVFVAVDKWKNARLKHPTATTQDIAEIALPDAAGAMLLTTSTTTVAFFATTICPVTPILCFALFCALLILFNYIINVVLLFPALALYDIWLMNGNQNVLINCGCCAKSITDRHDETEEDTEANDVSEETKPSLIHKILSAYFFFLKKFRYFILAACLIAIGICTYVALTIKLPDSVDVRLLPADHEFELHFKWKQELLSFLFFFAGGSSGQITWGLLPKDTGIRNNPDSLTAIVLDETFDPSSIEAQTYLLGFCERLFSSDIAAPYDSGYECPINRFDNWLRNQATLAVPDEQYISKCNNAEYLPMTQSDFDPCFVAWSEIFEEKNVLNKQGKIKIMQIKVTNKIKWDAPFAEMDTFWNKYETWMENERTSAPPGVNKMFHTSASFWWYDTNTSMLQTAIGAAGIAIAFSAVVVLLSSRSPTLTLFSGLCVTYVLAATTASLVGFGWNLGFLESICFAILIGISCDFVIHFGHAYIHKEGFVSRYERTKYAVIHMGPSILAAAVTTFSAAIAMLFCKVTFFIKFALILLMTIIHATVGSFVVYLVCTVTFGPAEPTKWMDSLLSQCSKNEKEGPENAVGGQFDNDGENVMYDLSGKDTSKF